MITFVPLIVSPRGYPKPKHAEHHVYWAAKENQLYFKQQLGVTFDLALPVSITLPETWAELQTFGTDGLKYWRHAMAEFVRRGYRICDTTKLFRLYYFRPYSEFKHFGGTVGMEVFGCPNVWPRTSARSDYKAYLMAGYSVAKVESMGFTVSWWDRDNPKSVIGGDAHETIHQLVEHSHDFAAQPNADGWPEITRGYPSFPNTYINPATAQALRESGYLA